jgi:hypothetical protein
MTKAKTQAQKARKARLMPHGVPKWVRCYDDGGKTLDRYTVVFTGRYKDRPKWGERGHCEYLGMSENPFSPQGFGQHGDDPSAIDRPTYSHLGKRIKFADLPPNCQNCVKQDYRALWEL